MGRAFRGQALARTDQGNAEYVPTRVCVLPLIPVMLLSVDSAALLVLLFLNRRAFGFRDFAVCRCLGFHIGDFGLTGFHSRRLAFR